MVNQNQIAKGTNLHQNSNMMGKNSNHMISPIVQGMNTNRGKRNSNMPNTIGGGPPLSSPMVNPRGMMTPNGFINDPPVPSTMFA